MFQDHLKNNKEPNIKVVAKMVNDEAKTSLDDILMELDDGIPLEALIKNAEKSKRIFIFHNL